jgi:serine/threonine protein kinase
MSDLIGRTLAGYRVEAELGRGGQAVVYRATQLSLQRQVALKVVAPGLGLDPGFAERFRREGVSAARLDHPHVVPVYEAGESDGFAFLAMKLVDGPALDGLVRKEGLLPRPRALAILSQVAQALDYAASQGLVHRDVKPGNILVGPGDHAYLSDFGLTKALESTTAITRTGTWMGTLEYMAPEQVAGRAVTAAADRYALGVIAYELLTGRSPFPREDRAALMYAHLHDAPAPASEARPELGSAVDAALARALAKEPEDRPTTAGELVDDVRRALVGTGSPVERQAAPTAVVSAPPTTSGPVPAGPPPVGVRSRKGPSRNMLLGTGGGLAAIAAAVVLVVAVSGGDGATEPLRTVTVQPTTQTASTPTSPVEESFPTLDEAALVGRTPDVARSSCERTNPTVKAPGATVSIRCSLRNQAIYYEQFPTLDAARSYYDSFITGQGLTRDEGRCPGKERGEASYGQGDGDIGRVACSTVNNSPSVVWTHEPLQVVATMVGEGLNPKKLLDLWEDAGPYE